MRSTEIETAAARQSWRPSFAQREYLLGILTLIFAVQYLDRQIIVILSQPIKQEFELSDAQMGILTGFVFSIPYCFMMLPMGWLVDRTNRRNLLALGLTAWSCLTVATGFVRNLFGLVVARALIAGAESVNHPTALSMIADHYDKRSRATAIGIFFAGPAVASVVGFTLIAIVAERWGWRTAFFAAGVPGLLLAVLLVLSVREPEREGAATIAAADAPPLSETLAFLRSQRSIVHLMLGIMLTAVVTSGFVAWMVPFFMRVHGLSLTQAAFVVSTAYGLTGALGQLFGGAIVDRMVARTNVRWFAGSAAIFSIIALVFQLGSALAPAAAMAIIMLALWALPAGCQYGPVLGSVQSLAMPRMRGIASSCTMLLVNLIGAGGGPLLVGLLSDSMGDRFDQSLQWSLAGLSLLQFWAIAHFLLAARTIETDLARVDANLSKSDVMDCEEGPVGELPAALRS